MCFSEGVMDDLNDLLKLTSSGWQQGVQPAGIISAVALKNLLAVFMSGVFWNFAWFRTSSQSSPLGNFWCNIPMQLFNGPLAVVRLWYTGAQTSDSFSWADACGAIGCGSSVLLFAVVNVIKHYSLVPHDVFIPGLKSFALVFRFRSVVLGHIISDQASPLLGR
ncbi:hypothetical protein K470DRAFT_22214 [Piedraia hortae CBS 480.64]|uniref:Uncharacterized protein n=1 Tax=Piedraia hortae CBS 480.64 TaxID=1314780 RepID=A0A6A7C3H2_9PEZI|nr:hypothetical protein K470DRAFT_22214 [Piedraia hortae CBS 480.64]